VALSAAIRRAIVWGYARVRVFEALLLEMVWLDRSAKISESLRLWIETTHNDERLIGG
jgi:hypothetical protein